MYPQHSVDLDMTYTVVEKPAGLILRFEDGVEYTVAEALLISGMGSYPASIGGQEAKRADIQGLHLLKRVFGGEIVLNRVSASIGRRRIKTRQKAQAGILDLHKREKEANDLIDRRYCN